MITFITQINIKKKTVQSRQIRECDRGSGLAASLTEFGYEEIKKKLNPMDSKLDKIETLDEKTLKKPSE